MKNTIWAKTYRGQKIAASETRQCDFVDIDSVRLIVRQICVDMDISQPVWLKKHENDIEQFRRAVFKPDDFVESVRFDKLEIEVYDET